MKHNDSEAAGVSVRFAAGSILTTVGTYDILATAVVSHGRSLACGGQPWMSDTDDARMCSACASPGVATGGVASTATRLTLLSALCKSAMDELSQTRL
ncbi:hypothetical protein NL676_008025 [Syzygium grande]|nr:hypothetical protein NL676_008025 [Syzygium grande]